MLSWRRRVTKNIRSEINMVEDKLEIGITGKHDYGEKAEMVRTCEKGRRERAKRNGRCTDTRKET